MDDNHETVEGTAFLYLVDGRVFVCQGNGVIREATSAERWDGEYFLLFASAGALDPIRGLAISPPAES